MDKPFIKHFTIMIRYLFFFFSGVYYLWIEYIQKQKHSFVLFLSKAIQRDLKLEFIRFKLKE